MSELEPNVELEPGEGGAEAVPVAPEAGAGEAAAVSQPAAEPIAGEGGEPQVDLSEIDLTSLPQFRNWQSQQDRKLADARQDTQNLQAQMQQQQRQLEQQMGELRMRDATPDEQAAYYRTQLAQRDAQMAQQQRQQQEATRIYNEGQAMLAEMGLKPDTPGLDTSGGLTSQGLAKLATSAARLVADREKKRQGEVAQVTKQATQDAVRATGASKANLATGSSNRSQAAQYREDLKKLPRGRSGRPPNQREIVKLKARYRAQGYDPDEGNYETAGKPHKK